MYIVGFNGPPQSGKDTLAQMLAEHMDQQGITSPVFLTSLSMPLREIAYCMVGVVGKQLEGEDYELFKKTLFSKPFMRLGRQILIDISEKFVVPTYGPDAMVQLLLRNYEMLRDTNAVLLIRDCGFQRELNPLIDAVGPDNLVLIRVERPYTDFGNDSREWVVNPLGRTWEIDNNQDLDHLRTEAGRIYGRLVNQCGWKL